MTMFSGHLTDIAVYKRRMFGEYAYVFWLMAGCNVMIPQLLWFRKLRRSLPCLLLIGVTVTIGMWLERFVIIVNTMEQGVIPATWANYMPSMTDVLMFAGTFGLFFGGILLFIRFFPCVSIVELCEQRSHQELGALKAHEGAMEGRYEKWSEFIEAFRNNPLEMEAISPFAVQEVERSSAAPDAFSKGAFRGGVTGLLLSSILAGWTQLVDYPLILQGKEVDLSRFIGFFPVLFETTLLGAGIGVILQFCRASGLLRWWHPWFESREYAEFSSRPAFYLWRKERT